MIVNVTLAGTTTGAKDSGSSGNSSVTVPPSPPKTAQGANGGSGGVGISAAVSVNLVNSDTRAFIADTTVGTTNSIDVVANTDADIWVASLSFAFDKSKAKGGISLAGSFAMNDIDRVSQAFTDNAVIGTDDINVSATIDDRVRAFAIGASGQKKKGTAAVTGSVSLNLITRDTLAAIGDTTTLTAGGDVTIVAADKLQLVAAGGGLAISGKVGVGAAAGVSVIDNKVDAHIGANAVVDAAGDIVISADSESLITSVALGVGIGTEQLGIAGSATSQNLTPDVQAYIAAGADVLTQRNLLIDADDSSTVIQVGGRVGVGKKAGVGIAITNLNVNRTVKAYIEAGAMVTALGNGNALTDPGGSLTGNGILIDASAADSTWLIAIAGAGGNQFAGAGSVVVHTLTSDVQAFIGAGASVNTHANIPTASAAQSVQLRADHSTSVLSVAGGIAVSGKVGVGAAADVEIVNKTVKAHIDSAAIVNARNDVIVQATSRESFLAVAVGIGAAGKVGLAGSAVVITLDTTTQAYIGGGPVAADGAVVSADGNVVVAADSDANFITAAGAIGGGGTVGFGISNSTIVKTDLTEAFIGENADVTAKGTGNAIAVFTGDKDTSGTKLTENIRGLSVAATSYEDFITIAAGGGGGGQVGAAGSATINILDETTRAYIDQGARINASNTGADPNQGVNVRASDNTTIKSVAGSAGVGGTAGIGAGADVGVITKLTEATIGTSAIVNAAGNVTIQAQSDDNIIGAAANAGIGGSAGIAGSASVFVLDTTTRAMIGNSVTVDAGGDAAVLADGAADILMITGSISGGGSAGIGVSNTTLVKTDTVEAFVGASANLTVNSLTVTATSSEKLLTVAAGGGLAGSAGIAGSATVNILNETTLAYIDQGATVTALQSITIRAYDDTQIFSVAGAIGGGGSAGIGAGVDVGVISKRTEAYIGPSANISAITNITVEALSSEAITSIAASLGVGGSVGIAGSASVYTVTNTTRAYIGNAATVTADGSVLVSAADDTGIVAIAGSVSGGGAAGIGAGAGVAVINKTTEAFIDQNADVTAQGLGNGITVNTGKFGIGFTSGQFNQNMPTFNSQGVSSHTPTVAPPGNQIALDFEPLQAVDQTADTIDLGSSPGLKTGDKVIYRNNGNNSVGGLSDGVEYFVIETADPTQVMLATTQANALNGTAINLTLATGTHTLEPVSASLTQQRGTTATTQIGFKGVAVTAINQDDFKTIAGSGGAAGTVAINLSGDVNVFTSNTSAYINDDATVTANNGSAVGEPSVLVAAGNDFYHLGLAAAASVSGAVAGTGAADIMIVTINTKAFVDDGAVVGAEGDIGVHAHASEDIVSVSAGASVSGTVAVSGAFSILTINSTTLAYIGDDNAVDLKGATASAGGNILISASDDTKLLMVAGSLGIGIGAVGIGASVGVTVISKDTQAFVGAHSTVDAGGNNAALINTVFDGDFSSTGPKTFSTLSAFSGLAVQAASSEDVTSIVAAGGGALFFGLGGGAAVEVLESDTRAYIGRSANINQGTQPSSASQSVNVSAVNDVTVFAFGGGIAGGLVGIGGGVDVGILRNDTSAFIANLANVDANQDIDINALAQKDVYSVAVSGAGGVAALAGSVSVWNIGTVYDSSYSVEGARFDPATQVGGTIILLTFDHELKTGDKVIYRNGGGSSIGGLTDGVEYFVIENADPRVLSLATTKANALNGAAINLNETTATGDQHRLDPAEDAVAALTTTTTNPNSNTTNPSTLSTTNTAAGQFSSFLNAFGPPRSRLAPSQSIVPMTA